METKYLKAIKNLKDFCFVVPSYQRGYRWGEREVKALLEDIWDFAQKIGGQNDSVIRDDFYCLQPIVVKQISSNHYNVIDGQQRLTTIFLILRYLKNKSFFSLSYETRKSSNEFLVNIKERLGDKSISMDFYYFKKAYVKIEAFFENELKGQDEYIKFENTLLEFCKVLWYEVDSDEAEVFIRLNIGKIPLLPAENIKALFLAKNGENNVRDLEEKAQLWYETELKAREDNDFRYMVLNKIDPRDIMRFDSGKEGLRMEDASKVSLRDDLMRIEVYLRAISGLNSNKDLFEYFYKVYKCGNLTDKWKELKVCINTFEGFAYRGNTKIDREIFHYLGFLILSGDGIHALYGMWKNQARKNNEEFRNLLFDRVRDKMSKSINRMEDCLYPQDGDILINVLLLFNLEYLITQESSNEYFKFNRFQLEEWSLEHIYAQKSKSIKTAIDNNSGEEIKNWLEEVLKYVDDDKRLPGRIQKAIDDMEFDHDLFDSIDKFFEESNFHGIKNLTLLDKGSNSKIGNLIFSKKRKEIERLGEEDRLIPIATRKVFNKEFSECKTNPDIFTKEDQRDYLKKIKKLLEKFITKDAS